MIFNHYAKHEVSTKAIIYAHDKKKVLVMQYFSRRAVFGLPGGHIDKAETPDDCIARELQEELGVKIRGLKRTDFFTRDINNPSIVLIYSAIAPKSLKLRPTHPQKEIGIWVTKEELMNLNISSHYRQSVLDNWPSS